MNAHVTDPRWSQLIDRAHAIDIAEVARRCGATLRKSGADYVGPCPAGHAKDDGFVVTPSKSIFRCRPCGDADGAAGDAITMAQHCLGLGFADAVELVTGESRPDRSHDESPDQRAERERKWAAAKAEADKKAAAQAKADERRKERRREQGAEILSRAVPIVGTHAWRYLTEGRGLILPDRMCRDLLFVDSVDYWGYDATKSVFLEQNPGAAERDQHKVFLATVPAMVARVRDHEGNDGFSIHLTFLDPVEPRKWAPPVDRDRNGVKHFIGSPKGGLIRLGRPTRRMAIGEGIETTGGFHNLGYGGDDLSFGVAGSLYFMPSIVLPACVEEVILLGDGDGKHPDKDAANMIKAGEAFAKSGRRVFIAAAPAGLDWDKVAKRVGARG